MPAKDEAIRMSDMNVAPPCRVGSCDPMDCHHTAIIKAMAAGHHGLSEESLWHLGWHRIAYMFVTVSAQIRWEIDSSRYLPVTQHVKACFHCAKCGVMTESIYPYWSLSPYSGDLQRARARQELAESHACVPFVRHG